MEENIKIQAEFEQLIEQLERLKNINELTSANSESSKEVILSVDSFVKATNEYAKSIELNLSKKSTEIDKLIIKLEKSIFKIENETNLLSTNVGTSFVGFKNETQSNINEILLELRKALQNNAQKIDNYKMSIHEIILKNTEKVIENNDNIFLDLSNSIARNDQSLNDNAQIQIDELGKIKQDIIQTERTQIQILTEYLKKSNETIIEKIETQNKKIENILYLICGLTILGTILSIIY